MNRLTRTVLDDFAAWVEAQGHRPVDLTPVADLCAAKAVIGDPTLIAGGLISEPDPRLWPGAGAAPFFRAMLMLVPTESDWLQEAMRAMPLYFDYLATLDDPLVVAADDPSDAKASFLEVFSPIEPVHVSTGTMVYRLVTGSGGTLSGADIMRLPWQEREAIGGPAFTVLSFTMENLPPVPVPSVTGRLAEESKLLADFIAVARAAISERRRPDGVEDWVWRQVVLQALVADIGDPDGLHPGPSLRQWDSGRADLKTRVWSRAFQCVALRSALGPDDDASKPLAHAIFTALQVAASSGEVQLEKVIAARPSGGVDPVRLRELVHRLETLGAVTIEDDVLRLAALGSTGLHQLGNWSGTPTPELLAIPSWRDDLTTSDVVAVMNADADGRVGATPAEGFPRGWVDRANPEQLTRLLLDAMPWLSESATARSWGVLLNIGEPAATLVRARFGTWLEPQARAWLIVSGFGSKHLLSPEEHGAILQGWNAAWDRIPS
ncbi:hypothetical protein [Kribbella deserti]|uniref:Uncharacterized protein n=1 Tax=Kribbella deserti TaxID=1926257 RepID=A0ABV6QFS4_9ACTN